MTMTHKDGVWNDTVTDMPKSASTKRVINAMSEDYREEIDNKIFINQLLEEAYPEHYTEIEMLILSISNYTHREISEVLNISRLGVTKRIAKAREILKSRTEEMLQGESL